MKPAVNNKQVKEWLNKFSFLEEELKYFSMKIERIGYETVHMDESATVDFLSGRINELISEIKAQKLLVVTNSSQLIDNTEMRLYISRFEDLRQDFKSLLEKHAVYEAA
ncbi:hypothetical protein [Chondrinema litorale]|uniref:hypothetical protein n=1 Tax=Chondrinema litorale TaxID=2994555 RepID=UPI0025432287|nr:hypothetical protein [Chondrinema litorale]UZR92598.1 hypothetical protein OQ292_12100 [Chondrinema litorale]